MDQVQEDLHHQLDQLHVLAAEINDPLAERLVRDLIVELEGRLMAEALNASRLALRLGPRIRPEENLPGDAGRRFCISST
jgi:hypothetical protein